MLLWWLVALVFRWRIQFGIQTLLVMTLAVALPFSWLAVEIKKAREQKEAANEIAKRGGSVLYEWEVDAQYIPLHDAQAPGPGLLRSLLGDDFCMRVVVVWIRGDSVEKDPESLQHVKGLNSLHALHIWSPEVSDAGLLNLKGLNELQDLDLYSTHVSDDGLRQLMRLNQLRQLNLVNTKVSKDGVKKLQQALPNCHIIH